MVLIGRDISYLYLCNTITGRETRKESPCEILYFFANFFPENMLTIPEYATISNLQEKKRRRVKKT